MILCCQLIKKKIVGCSDKFVVIGKLCKKKIFSLDSALINAYCYSIKFVSWYKFSSLSRNLKLWRSDIFDQIFSQQFPAEIAVGLLLVGEYMSLNCDSFF
jgi:hypothetical protein